MMWNVSAVDVDAMAATGAVIAQKRGSRIASSRVEGVEKASHLAAMSVGVYTGGTPNLAAIKAGLEIPHSDYIVFHSLDTLVGSIYLLIMLTLGIRLFRSWLPEPALASAEQRISTNAASARTTSASRSCTSTR